MAKLKAQIVTEINNLFVTNGNITAVETSTTLKDILDCTELNDKGDLVGIENRLTAVEGVNNTQNLRLDFLEQNSNNQGRYQFEIPFQNSTLSGFLSFRGLTNHFVNITFRIRVLESFSGTITFSSPQLAILKGMIEGTIDYATNYMLNFLVTITNEAIAVQQDGYFRVGNLNMHFMDDETITIRIQNYHNEPQGLLANDEIYTSIALHSKYMDITGKIGTDLNKDAKDPKDVFVANPNDPKTGLKDGTFVTGTIGNVKAKNAPILEATKLTVSTTTPTTRSSTSKATASTKKGTTTKVTASKKPVSSTKTAPTAKTSIKKQNREEVKPVSKPKVAANKPSKPRTKK